MEERKGDKKRERGEGREDARIVLSEEEEEEAVDQQERERERGKLLSALLLAKPLSRWAQFHVPEKKKESALAQAQALALEMAIALVD